MPYTGIIKGNTENVSVVQVTINPASVAANTTAEQTFTIDGLAVGDVVFVNKPSLSAGLGIAGARVSSANTLAITFINTAGSPIDAGSETYLVGVISPGVARTRVSD